MRTRVWEVFLAAVVLLGLAALVAVDRTLLEVVAVAGAAATVAGVAVHRPRSGRAWCVLAGGLALLALGGPVGVAGYPLLTAGLGLLVAARGRSTDRVSLPDAAIVIAGADAVWWVHVVSPALEDPALDV